MKESDAEREAEWRLMWGRQLAHLVLLLAALAVGVWFVQRISKRADLQVIGEHYRQVEESPWPSRWTPRFRGADGRRRRAEEV